MDLDGVKLRKEKSVPHRGPVEREDSRQNNEDGKKKKKSTSRDENVRESQKPRLDTENHKTPGGDVA